MGRGRNFLKEMQKEGSFFKVILVGEKFFMPHEIKLMKVKCFDKEKMLGERAREKSRQKIESERSQKHARCIYRKTPTN